MNAPAFFLAGDSTTAVLSSEGGGWSDGFLSSLTAPAWGRNFGHNGATTISFVSGGDWATVLNNVKSNKTTYACYVTIQFGHNDQKASANISLSDYRTNLEKLVEGMKAAGGTPILMTPLTRRVFTSAHRTTDSLHDQRIATIAAAQSTQTRYVDPNAASVAYAETIGNVSSQAYNLDEGDTAHLNNHGSVVFGRMVADLLLGHPPRVGKTIESYPLDAYLQEWIKPSEKLSGKIWAGLPA